MNQPIAPPSIPSPPGVAARPTDQDPSGRNGSAPHARGRAHILALDDQTDVLHGLAAVLGPHHHLHAFHRAESLYRYLDAGHPCDLILLDAVMPEPDGFEVCRTLRARPSMDTIPMIFLTSLDDSVEEAHALRCGAADFVHKPISAPVLLARIHHHLQLSHALRTIRESHLRLEEAVMLRTRELAHRNAQLVSSLKMLETTRNAVLVSLTSLAETRENDTGRHVVRTQRYIGTLARALRLNPSYAELLDDATIEAFCSSAPLHDIGKVAIPDHILRKPGPLDPNEMALMKTHVDRGREAIERAQQACPTIDPELFEGLHVSGQAFLAHAHDIVWCHHERWDGTGYPRGLAGTQIPVSARLMSVADVYDALRTPRIYKRAYPHDEACHYLVEQRGRQFDPNIIDAFLRVEGEFDRIARELAD